MKLLTKSVVVATVLCFVAGLSAGAAVTSYSSGAGDLFMGQNLIALPVVPTDLDGSGNGPGYPEFILSPIDITGTNLSRWNAATQTGLYRGDTGFGNLLSSDGYTLTAADSTPFSFNGANDLQQTDYWISLPKMGTTVVGNPYLYSVDWTQIAVTNGMTTVSIDTAITNGWLSNVANAPYVPAVMGFDNSWKYDVPIGPASSMPASPQATTQFAATRLEPWRGYKITSLVDNLALIVTARKATDNVFSISGTITLAGSSNVASCPVIVELRDLAGNKLVRTIKHVDEYGNYVLDGVAPGAYNVAFKGANTLAQIIPVTVAANVAGVNVALVNGDVTGDNFVGLTDYTTWKTAYNTAPGATKWDVRADLTCDNFIGLTDYTTWKTNYNKSGDAAW
jgi:hypothetical protein